MRANMRAAEDPDARAPVQDADDDAVHSARERMGMEDALLNASTIASDAVPSEVDAVPHDRYHLAFFILYLQGVGCLFPWNAFITKTDYYALAFRGSEYASSFESVVTTTFTLLGLVTILGMQRVQHLSSPRSRIIGGLTLQLGVFLVIFGFSAAPLVLPTEQLAPFLQRTRAPLFAVTVAGVALAGFAQSVITGSIFTYATLYARPIYLQAISAGMGVAGLSVSLGSLATALPQTAEACAPDGDEADSAQVDRATVVGAAVYFGLSCVLLGLCLAAFFALERLPFTLECKKREALLTMAEEGRLEERRLAERRLAAVRPRTVPETETEMPLSLANVAGAGRGGGGGEAATAAAAGVAAKATPPALLPQLWAWALSLMLVYVVTLGLFPSLTSTIQSTAGSCSWQHMFVPVHPRTAPHSPSQPLATPRSPSQPLAAPHSPWLSPSPGRLRHLQCWRHARPQPTRRRAHVPPATRPNAAAHRLHPTIHDVQRHPQLWRVAPRLGAPRLRRVAAARDGSLLALQRLAHFVRPHARARGRAAFGARPRRLAYDLLPQRRPLRWLGALLRRQVDHVRRVQPFRQPSRGTVSVTTSRTVSPHAAFCGWAFFTAPCMTIDISSRYTYRIISPQPLIALI